MPLFYLVEKEAATPRNKITFST